MADENEPRQCPHPSEHAAHHWMRQGSPLLRCSGFPMPEPSDQDRMIVHRIETDGGSHIEPPLNQRWTDLARLQWSAAVVTLDVGFEVTVSAPDPTMRAYNVMMPGCSIGSGGFSDTWTTLNGISAGARAALWVRGER